MIEAVEIFVAITSLIVGASHLLRPREWAAAYDHLHQLGRPGAFVNGALHLAAGAMIVAILHSWAWPELVLTTLGCLLIAKGALCFLAPDLALKSMKRGADSPRGFQIAGMLLIAIGLGPNIAGGITHRLSERSERSRAFLSMSAAHRQISWSRKYVICVRPTIADLMGEPLGSR